MDKLGKDPRFLYSNDDKGRAEALAEYTRLIDTATERCKQLVPHVSESEIEVRRVEPFKEATAPGAYYEGGAHGRHAPGNFLREPARHE